MNIKKARKMLDFTPTPAEEAFKTTLAWYEEAFVKFPAQRDSILTDLFQTAVPKENRFSHHIHKIKRNILTCCML